MAATYTYIHMHMHMCVCVYIAHKHTYRYIPHEKLHGIRWVLTPATRKDLAARTWGVFWYKSKIPVLFDIMVQIKQTRGTGVESPSPGSIYIYI